VAKMDGGHLVTRALKREGFDVLFGISGGPIFQIVDGCLDDDIRLVHVRHEQAAAMMAHGWARVTGKPGVAAFASGPGTINAATGVANAHSNASPVLYIGGSSRMAMDEMGGFQEIDQFEVMRPITKWAHIVPDARRIPEFISIALRHANTGRPGPVYLDIPGDILSQQVDEESVWYPTCSRSAARPLGDPAQVSRAIDLLSKAERPLVIIGSGVWWSQAAEEVGRFIEASGLPFVATPMGRGAVPDDSPQCFGSARSFALKNADTILVLGGRLNWILGFGRPPRYAPDVRMIQVDIEPSELGHNKDMAVGIVGDIKAVVGQLMPGAEEVLSKKAWGEWHGRLREAAGANDERMEPLRRSNQAPVHPIRLCTEIAEFLDRDAIVAVDGGEILDFGRMSIPTYYPGHRINCGTFGCLGVGVPMAIAAKIAFPNKQVLCLTGDGAFGFNGMELETAVRHAPTVTVVANDSQWGQCVHIQQRSYGTDRVIDTRISPSRYDLMMKAFGGHGEHVERPEDIRPALERAFASGKAACIDVAIDPEASPRTAFREGD